jgi:ComF family protein|nr:double zinc ribbon domain-containing protein [Kofleriaceae bacterium]
MPHWLDWLFAPQCAACGAPTTASEPLCETCAVTLDPLGACCPRCAEPMGERAVTCQRCVREPLPLERIASPWRFGGSLASAIRRLKFTGASHVARAVAPLWAPVLASAAAAIASAGDSLHGAALVVPVPLHWRRRVQRGYDHAWLLAVHACASAGMPPPVPALRRVRAAAPQSTLTAAERAHNLRDAFAVRRSRARGVAGRAVVLVDDVATTCATLAAAARPLLAAGATRVLAVTLART